MAGFSQYLAAHLPHMLFVTLGLGYILGSVRFGSFKLGATVGTLVVGLLISQLCPFVVPSALKSVLFALFIYTIGFEVGPSFFSSLRSSGIKIVFQSVFFSGVALAVCVLCAKLLGFDAPTMMGIMAGSLTQATIMGATESDSATVAFALTYIFGTLGVVVLVRNVIPSITKTNLRVAVKNKVDSDGSLRDSTGNDVHLPVVRALIVGPGAPCVGETVDQVEWIYHSTMEVAGLYRKDKKLPVTQATVIDEGDVLVLVGSADSIIAFDDDHIQETADPKYLDISMRTEEIVLTKDFAEEGEDILSGNCLYLQSVRRDGKEVTDEGQYFLDGNVIKVTGPSTMVDKTVRIMGYVKDTGASTDLAYFGLAVAVGLILGAISVSVFGVSLSLSESGGALIAGLLSGAFYQREPKVGYIPDSSRWLMKNLGLNLYIAALALEKGNSFGAAMAHQGILILLVGMVVTVAPHLLTYAFSRRVLKLDVVDALGGLCGCGTCTAALNGLSEETGSSIFALSYAPGYAVGNILLTICGILLPSILG